MSNLAIRPDQTGFTPQQLASLKQLGVDKVADGDLAVFFHQCQRTGLDPFAKQIYLVGRFDSRAGGMRYTIQTGIDGYRLIAERTGVYAGSDEVWDEQDGRLLSATVTVRKIVAGQVCEFTATARFSEYVQTGKDGKPMGLWAKMPHRMLAKCAEALALRKAFPQDLSGLYTAEEMSQADSPAPAPVQQVDGPLSAENFAKFEKACADAGLDPEAVLAAAGVQIADVRQSHLPAMRDAFARMKQQKADAEIIEAEVVEPSAADVADAAWVAEASDDDMLFEQVKQVFDAVEVPAKPKQVRNPEQPASGPQMGKIKALLTGKGIKDRPSQLKELAVMVGREITSFDVLTKGEASTVIERLVG